MGRPFRKTPDVPHASPPNGWTRRERAIAITAAFLVFAILGVAVWQTGSVREAPVVPAEHKSLSYAPLPDSLLTRDDGFDRPKPRAGDVGDSKQPKEALPAESAPRPRASAPIVGSASPARQAGNATAAGAQATLENPKDQSTVSDAASGVTRPPAAIAGTTVPATAQLQKTIQPQKPGPDESLAALDSDDYEENGAEDFVCPVPWLQTSRMIERVKYLSSLQNLLKAGWEEKPTALDTARNHFESARGLCTEDPRLFYAFGLVLWKHDRHFEARRE